MCRLGKSPNRKGEGNIHRNKQGGTTRILENNHRKSPKNLKDITMRTNHTLTDKWNPKVIQLKLKSRNTLVGQYHDAFKLKFLCTDLRHLLTGKVRGVCSSRGFLFPNKYIFLCPTNLLFWCPKNTSVPTEPLHINTIKDKTRGQSYFHICRA
jgi:hypothetical protein